MKYSLLIVALLSTSSLLSAFELFDWGQPDESGIVAQKQPEMVLANSPQQEMLKKEQRVRVSIVGQGVAPMKTESPAQAYALAKRAAIADGYRLIAEKVKGVRVEGQDLIENMMIKRSSVRTHVNAMVKNANIVETSFKDGLCEVEMEIVLSYTDFTL